MASTPEAITDELTGLYQDLERLHMVPLWKIAPRLLPREPQPQAIPYLWRWPEIASLAHRAARLVPIERGGERRVIAFMNPGLGGKWAATSTLWAGVQILLPGETAPAHRHSPAAIRFIIQGKGAYTTVEGDQCLMSPGDLVLTPPWTWHDHGNSTSEPVLWMDGLDVPFVRDMDAGFFEPFAGAQQPMTKPVNDSERRYGIGQLRPTWEHPAGPSSPLLNYKWEQTEEALERLATSGASPFDDVALEYINPHTGGSVLPTLACWIQLIRPGVQTKAHRQTNSAVYHVFRGEGYSVINGKRFTWNTGDFFVVPPWAWHEHANNARQGAILFSVQDTPILQALGLYREQVYETNGGHQAIT
jgi:gentisate 1,2-dioxygenase